VKRTTCASPHEGKGILWKAAFTGEADSIYLMDIRFYEEAGIIPSRPAVASFRCPDMKTIRRIGMLKFARQIGFTLGKGF
jgi:hypothetical protein